jgi:ribosomal protein L12E/L44/L45/RPP1/RPP2
LHYSSIYNKKFTCCERTSFARPSKEVESGQKKKKKKMKKEEEEEKEEKEEEEEERKQSYFLYSWLKSDKRF